MQFPKGIFSIPNLLCYFRVAYLPVMVLLFHLDYIWRARTCPATDTGCVPSEGVSWPAWTNVALYTLAGLTDFLDGLIARWLKQETLLGKFLDSSTDKLVVCVSLVCLVAYQQLQGIWMIMVIIIISREILISGVREFMALYNVVVKISWIGKWKLTIQMLFIGFLIAGEYGEDLVPHAVVIGRAGFVLATAMTIWSGWDYLREAWKTIKRLETEGKV